MDQPEVLSPRRRLIEHRPKRSTDDVFIDDQDDDDDDGDDLAIAVPDSLAELLTPRERARRMSRRDSQDSFSASPSRGSAIQKALWAGGNVGPERLAQSAGPTMGPGFLQGLWSAEGGDARKVQSPQKPSGDLTFGSNTAIAPTSRQSLLTQQRSPTSPQDQKQRSPVKSIGGERSDLDANASPFLIRTLADPSSPSAKALKEHAPGQSLPGGLANALSRLHLQGAKPGSGLANTAMDGQAGGDDVGISPRVAGLGKKHEVAEEGLFVLEG